MTLHIENPEETSRKLLDLINDYKVAGYKVNTHKSLAFLYINNEKIREIKETIPFTIAMKRRKYLEIMLPKEMRRGGKKTQNCTKKIFTTQIIMMVSSLS